MISCGMFSGSGEHSKADLENDDAMITSFCAEVTESIHLQDEAFAM